MNIDMWYNDNPKDVTAISVSFSDADCIYRGNCYIDGKIVGDYSTSDSVELENTFPLVKINWDYEEEPLEDDLGSVL